MLKFAVLTAALLAATSLVAASAPMAEAVAEPMASPEALAALDPTLPGRRLCRGFDASGAVLEQQLKLAAAYAQQSGFAAGELGLYQGISRSDLPTGGMNEQARLYFDQGLALAYGFNHQAAIRSFRRARALDPSCAMCAWGIAMANGPNINSGMDDDGNRAALVALEEAQRLSDGLPPLAQELIAAQAARYSAAPGADRAALDAAYADAMLAIAAKNPASDDLAVLAAEAAMNTSPWNYWDLETGEPRARIAEAVALVEAVMARNPTHPQASHLYIHLLELPQPGRAEAAADRLAASAPAALGHLVHMPAHIYYRTGRYRDSIAANIAAARADEAYLRHVGDGGLYRFGYYPHNVHFLLSSAQMMGDVSTVFGQTEKLKTILDVDVARALPWVQAIHAAPHFALAQYGSPEAILALTATPSELAYVEAMRHYARAVAHARNGDRAGFAKEQAALDALIDAPGVTAMVAAGFPAPDILRLASAVASGRLALEAGQPREAVAQFRRAVELQKAIPYNEPPYWYYPVSQSLGAALYLAGEYSEARDAFRQALIEAPNDGMALYGLARTERRLGHRPEAQAAEAALARVWLGEPGWLRMERL